MGPLATCRGVKPDRWHALGVSVCLVGAALIDGHREAQKARVPQFPNYKKKAEGALSRLAAADPDADIA